MADCDLTHGGCKCERHGVGDAEHEHVHDHEQDHVHVHERASGAQPARAGRLGWWAGGVRFFGWWLGMSGLMGMFAVCPCCGAAACANGMVGMGFVGAVMASLMRVRRWFGGPRAAGS